MSLVGGLHHKMLAVVAAGGIGTLTYKWATRDRNQHFISWQHLRSQLLPRGAVLKVNVRDDRCAEIYLSEEQKVLMMVPSIEAFERKLIAEQMQLGVDASNWIEVTHSKAFDPHLLLNLVVMGMWAGVFLWSASAFSRTAKRGMDGMRNTTTFKVNKGDHVNTSFKDVAGLDAPKQEVMEFVSFLKDPERFTKLGAKVPNGVMLMGPPGTGKTLLAKAVAGESKVPFISASGSDFVEMFVGVGPARVRSLFKQARQHGTCIIYIDEIDAIGRPRGRGIASGGNDERENTLNQLLVEMDGFEKDRGKVVVMASTNVAPDQLDSALLRPGRFDRSIFIDRPEVRERQEIFYVHLAKLKLQSLAELRQDEADRKQRTEKAGGSYNPELEKGPSEEEIANIKAKTENDPVVVHHFARRLANLTPGMVGADIANVCNEGALIAAREKAVTISLNHMERAIDRVIGGIERKSKVLSPFERKVVAYHEAGHAVAGWFLRHADPLMKITIIPRGVAALGYAQYLPKDSKIQTAEQLLDRICVLLGGRCSELLHFNHLSTGAQDDLRKVTSIAYTKVSTLGMFEGGGHISFPPPGQEGTMLKPYSDEMAQMFDQEVKKLVDRAFERTKQLLLEKSKEVKLVAEYLLTHEVITRDEFQRLVGPRPEGFEASKEGQS